MSVSMGGVGQRGHSGLGIQVATERNRNLPPEALWPGGVEWTWNKKNGPDRASSEELRANSVD